MKNKPRAYTKEFRREAVQFALNSSSVSKVAEDLGLPKATLHTWVQKAKQVGETTDDTTHQSVSVGDVIKENRRLKKELVRLEQEKAILKKAATHFAKELG